MQQSPVPTRASAKFYFIVERQHGSSEEGRTQKGRRAQEFWRQEIVEPQEHGTQERRSQVDGTQEQLTQKEQQPESLDSRLVSIHEKAGDLAGFFLYRE
jgi:hypothetical protein